jgi:nucleotide-binding universal stress UspA family protein
MQPLSRILLPVDFSERSMGAARYARALALRFGSEIVLLHVLAPPNCEWGELEAGGTRLAELYRNQSGRAERELEGFADTWLAGCPVRRVALEGEAAERIVEFANAEEAGLIVMATHGFGHFRRFILGSNTAKVLHDADCPVWTGAHLEAAPAAASIPIGHVLCAVDLGPQSSKTLCWAALLARQFDARLTLLHAVSCACDPSDPVQASAHEAMRRAAVAELRRLEEFVHAEAEPAVECGEPAQTICAAAERRGVYGRLRTNAYAIIRQSPCPVVSV